ncbi:hypothetical protein ACSUZJ_20775 [Telluria sp. B2]
MEFLVDKSISSYLKQMLPKDSVDNCLVLAYGYFDADSLPMTEVWEWLEGADDRHLLLVVGVHGKPGFSAYLAATEGEGTIPMTTVSDEDIDKLTRNLTRLFSACEWGLETLEDPLSPSLSARIHIVIAEHFHAKLAMTAQISSPVNFYRAWPAQWVPTAALFGSSNITYAAHHYNIEFDTRLDRQDTAALKALAPASRALIKSAIAAALVDESVSEKLTRHVIDAIAECLDEAEAKRRQATGRKEQAAYEAARIEADRELD